MKNQRHTLEDLRPFELEKLEEKSKDKNLFCHLLTFFFVALSLASFLLLIPNAGKEIYKMDSLPAFAFRQLLFFIAVQTYGFYCYKVFRKILKVDEIDDVLSRFETEARLFLKSQRLSFKLKNVNIDRLLK